MLKLLLTLPFQDAGAKLTGTCHKLSTDSLGCRWSTLCGPEACTPEKFLGGLISGNAEPTHPCLPKVKLDQYASSAHCIDWLGL